MAPDVVSRQGFKRVNYDERCDVWSCGALLLVVLCGALPPTDFWRRGLSPDFVKSWMAKSGNIFSQELMDFSGRGIFVERKARMSTAQSRTSNIEEGLMACRAKCEHVFENRGVEMKMLMIKIHE